MEDIKQISFSGEVDNRKVSIVNAADEVVTLPISEDEYQDTQATLKDFNDRAAADAEPEAEELDEAAPVAEVEAE